MPQALEIRPLHAQQLSAPRHVISAQPHDIQSQSQHGLDNTMFSTKGGDVRMVMLHRYCW